MHESRTHETFDLLRKMEPFAGCGDDVIRQITRSMSEVLVSAGETLMAEGEPGDAMYLVLEGRLKVIGRGPGGEEIVLAYMSAGMPIGEIQLAIGGSRTSTVIAVADGRLGKLHRDDYDRLSAEHPELVRIVVDAVRQRLRRSQLASLLPKFFGPVDELAFAELEATLQWVRLEPGEVLFHQGDPGDSWYIVGSGRLRIEVRDPAGEVHLVGESGYGEGIGEAALLDDAARSATVHALRETDLVRLSREDFQRIALKYPRLLLAISQILIRRTRAASSAAPGQAGLQIAVLPSDPDAPVALVAERLAGKLSAFGRTLHLSSGRLRALGIIEKPAELPDDHPAWIRFSAWIEEQSRSHPYVILEADPANTAWTRRVLRQADHVLLVVDAAAGAGPGSIEAALFPRDEATVVRPRRTLVVVHGDDVRAPSGTRARLAARRVDRHVHVRRSLDADFGRLARLLVGKSVGLALGGGGARGYAHLGVIRALLERGVPIDAVCGTSMGAIMGAAWAMGRTPGEIVIENKRFIREKPFSEYTIPMIALLSTRLIEWCAKETFGVTEIEDFWTDFFCISTNLTSGEMVTIDRGPAWHATRASGALPGIIMPVLLDGQLLVDGGVINNLPGDVMRERHGGTVIAVNVSPEEDMSFPFLEIPAQWNIFWSRVLPFRKSLAAPSISDILMRTLLLSSAARTKAVSRSVDYYFRLPIDRFGMLEFNAIEAIVEAGYRYTLDQLAGWDLSRAWELGLPPGLPRAESAGGGKDEARGEDSAAAGLAAA